MKPYGTIELTVSSPEQSFTEPISVSEAKGWLRVRGSSEDAAIGRLITGVRAETENQQGIDLVEKQWDLRLDEFPDCEIALRRPLQSVQLVQYTDSDGNVTALAEGTDYVVDTARGLILPAYGESWPAFVPAPSSAVLVRFTSGYSASDTFWSNDGASIYQRMQFGIVRLYDIRTELDIAQIAAVLGYGATPRA